MTRTSSSRCLKQCAICGLNPFLMLPMIYVCSLYTYVQNSRLESNPSHPRSTTITNEPWQINHTIISWPQNTDIYFQCNMLNDCMPPTNLVCSPNSAVYRVKMHLLMFRDQANSPFHGCDTFHKLAIFYQKRAIAWKSKNIHDFTSRCISLGNASLTGRPI